MLVNKTLVILCAKYLGNNFNVCEKNCVSMGPTLIPFILAGCVNRFLVFSRTSGIFEFCRATFVVFYFYNARRL